MSVYIITTETFPNGMAATRRIRCYAKALAERDYCQVIIVNRCEDSQKPLGNTEAQGFVGKYSYKYIGGSTAKIKNRLFATFVLILDVLKLIIYLSSHLTKKDRVIYYAYNVPLLKLVTLIIHLKRSKLFYELCEHPSIQCSKCPSVPGEEIKWMKRNLSQCDGIIVISTPLEKLVQKAFNGEMRTIKIPVLFESIIEEKIREMNNGMPYIMHTGSLSQRKDGIVHSLIAFGIAINKYGINMDYILTGNLDRSRDKSTILKVIDEYGIQDKVKFVGFLSNEEMITYQVNAYMTIINKEDNLQNRYCFATKFCEYLNAECLLITTNIGESSCYLTDGIDCKLFTPGNVDELSNIIVDMYNNREERDLIAKLGRKLAREHFYCLNYSDSLNKFLQCV